MANVRFIKTMKERYLNRDTYDDTALYFCQDTHELYWGSRLLSDGIRVVAKYEELPELSRAADGIVYYVHDTRNGYTISPDRTEWLQTIYAPVTNMSDVPEGEEYNVVATVGAVRDLEEELRKYIDEQTFMGNDESIDYGEI